MNLTFPNVRQEEGDLYFKIVLSIIIGKHMKNLLFKFNRNRTITKDYFFEGEGGVGGWQERDPNSKFYYNVLLVNICKCCVSNSSKIAL